MLRKSPRSYLDSTAKTNKDVVIDWYEWCGYMRNSQLTKYATHFAFHDVGDREPAMESKELDSNSDSAP